MLLFFWGFRLSWGLQFRQVERKAIDVALGFVGLREVGKNRGYWIDKFNKKVGVKVGSPWCASFVSFCLDSVRSRFPIRTALARGFLRVRKYVVPIGKVLRGEYIVERGDLVVWRYGNGWQGHVGFVIRQIDNDKFETVEGNTKCGHIRDGDGVYKCFRRVQVMNYFRITDVVVVGG